MFEIAFKVNPDSDFYKNYFMKKVYGLRFIAFIGAARGYKRYSRFSVNKNAL